MPVKTVNIGEAKAQLSRLVEAAARGEPFIITKRGRPLVRVEPLQRLGFMAGEIIMPRNIKTPFAKDIDEMFYGSED